MSYQIELYIGDKKYLFVKKDDLLHDGLSTLVTAFDEVTAEVNKYDDNKAILRALLKDAGVKTVKDTEAKRSDIAYEHISPLASGKPGDIKHVIFFKNGDIDLHIKRNACLDPDFIEQ